MSPHPGPDAEGAGQTLFAFVRHWSRRWETTTESSRVDRGRQVLVLEAVHALQEGSEVTVNDVAAELAMDQSGASRLLADAARQGYVLLDPSPADRRRRTVAITPNGRALLDAAHRWQDEVFATMTTDWTQTQRADFHAAMRSLLAASTDL